MTPHEIQEFKEYAAHPTTQLRNKIVEENLYIVDILIRKYLGKGVDYDDLYQVGAIALVSAVERFDPSRGYEFRSFATPTILGEIKKYLREQAVIKVNKDTIKLKCLIDKTSSYLCQKFQREPTVKETIENAATSLRKTNGYSRKYTQFRKSLCKRDDFRRT